MDMDDTSFNKDPDLETDGKSKWFKSYSRLGGRTKTFSWKQFKRWITPLACIAAALVLVALLLYMVIHATSSSNGSLATKQDVVDLYRFINESFSQQQNDQDESCGRSNLSLSLQLQDQIYAAQNNIQRLQSNMSFFGSQISSIQSNLTDLSGHVDALQETVQNVTDKEASYDLDLRNIQKHVAELTKKVSLLEAYAGNLSIADHLQDIEEALTDGNMSALISRIKSTVTNLAGVQDHIISQITSLQLNVSQLNGGIDTLHDSIQQQTARAQEVNSSYSIRLVQVENSVTSLSTKVHSPLNLYERCKKDTASCTIDPITRSDYWRDCATKYLPIDMPVSQKAK